MASRDAIVAYCDERLEAATYQDFGPNGLQIEGSPDIDRLAVAVSASQRTLEAAVSWNANALLVHHGLLWGGQAHSLTGIFGKRLRTIFKHDLNLISYHLPLDGHPEIGNNARLCQILGFTMAGQFAEAGGRLLGVIGAHEAGLTISELTDRLIAELHHSPILVGPVPDASPQEGLVHTIGIVSGSGYSALAEASRLGCQALLTGDIREPTMAEARERGITVIAAGHEATERCGVQALAAELAEKFKIEMRFFDDPNPI